MATAQVPQHYNTESIASLTPSQDDITGDGTTSNVLIIGELLKQADRYISEVSYTHLLYNCNPSLSLTHTYQGLHPRIVAEGLDKAKEKALSVSWVSVMSVMSEGVLVVTGAGGGEGE